MLISLQGGFVGTFRIIPDSVPFSVGPDGIIRVKNPLELDRETTTSFNFQVSEIKDKTIYGTGDVRFNYCWEKVVLLCSSDSTTLTSVFTHVK